MKTIVTLDQADQPYGFPQLDGSGSMTANVDSVMVNAQMFMNPQTIVSNINIPSQHNAFLAGPVGFSASVTVGSGSYLAIL